MGAAFMKTLSNLYERLSSYPVQKKPIRFYSQRNFTAIGEEKVEVVVEKTVTSDPFKQMGAKIVATLAEVARKDQNWQRETFPEWDRVTLTNCNDIFILFSSGVDGMVDVDNFCRCLDSLGHRGGRQEREDWFKQADVNDDGMLNFQEFTTFLYSNPVLRKKCQQVGGEILFVNSLDIGDQLYYGLY